MKLKKGIILTDVSDKKVLVDSGASGECFQGIIKLNDSAAMLAEKLKEEVTLAELVKTLTEEYGISEEIAKSDITVFLDQLRETNMLED